MILSTGEFKKTCRTRRKRGCRRGNREKAKISSGISCRFMAGKIKFMKNITKILKNIYDRSVKDFITPGMVSYEYQS
jgi:hypothetical protein